MFAEVQYPEQLSGQDLDAYLARGWFRMGQTIFTENFHRFEANIYSTVWLRILLEEYAEDSNHRKLSTRTSGFSTVFRKAEITPEKEALFKLYAASVAFQASQSLHHLLFGEKAEAENIFNSHEVAVYDGEKLIACGIFDLGATSAQGIVSFYDPGYKHYSLGKYLIYSKVRYCKDEHLLYFYPGYFTPGNHLFDYKLTIGRKAMQFFQLSSNSWAPMAAFSASDNPYQTMHERLTSLQLALTSNGVYSQLLKYEFYNVNLMLQLRGTGLFEFPVFLFFNIEAGLTEEPVIVFDVRDNQYHLLMCLPVWEISETEPVDSFYSAYILKASAPMLSSQNESEMAAHLAMILGGNKGSAELQLP